MPFQIDTRYYADPLMIHWQPSCDISALDRKVLVELVEENAQHLGTGHLIKENGPIIATGHQAWFWHPGILAKDIAMAEAARYHKGHPLHLVVDHDVHPAMQLPIPILEDQKMVRKVIQLAKVREDVPIASQRPIDIKQVQDNLWYLKQEQSASLGNAMVDIPECLNLAQQITVILTRLMKRWVGSVPVLYSTQLLKLPSAKDLLAQMLDNPISMARAYNNAINEVPNAGISPLQIQTDRVELPLWLIQWGQPRTRVYADIADNDALLVDQLGNVLDPDKQLLAPKALFLSALMRGVVSQLFIHGKGGGVYDQVTEIWWAQWKQPQLCPLAIASADLYMKWNVPFADEDDLEQAIAYLHQLHHNIDRHVEVDTKSKHKKSQLIKFLADRYAKRRDKKLWFKQLHDLNDQLRQQHAHLIDAARDQLAFAQNGIANRELASRRDWPFFLYPADQIEQLIQMIRQANEHH